MTATENSSVWLPPEIWRICLRWATLPPSGRSPLDEPRTCLDPMYLPCLSHILIDDKAAFCDSLEQTSVYPAKRAVVLVCKAWNEMAAEYLYEHIICGVSQVPDSYSAFISVLQGTRGEQLARFVIRVDIRDSFDYHRRQSALLRLCPNLQCVYLNLHLFHYPYPYSNTQRNLPTVSVSCELLQTPEYERFWSAADHWRSLTFRFDVPSSAMPVAQENILPPPPCYNGKEFTNLRHIVIISMGHPRYSIRNLKHWPLPSLTHLTITSFMPSAGRKYGDVLDMLQSSGLGLRLKFFALRVHYNTSSFHTTTVSGSLALLDAMPNLEEVALPCFWVPGPPPHTTVTFPKVHTVGMEIERFDYTAAVTLENVFATYAATCCNLFPNMRGIRTTSTKPLHTVSHFIPRRVGPMIHLKKAAVVLKSRGVKFEDCAGWDIFQLF